jgi:hypothetical protein
MQVSDIFSQIPVQLHRLRIRLVTALNPNPFGFVPILSPAAASMQEKNAAARHLFS